MSTVFVNSLLKGGIKLTMVMVIFLTKPIKHATLCRKKRLRIGTIHGLINRHNNKRITVMLVFFQRRTIILLTVPCVFCLGNLPTFSARGEE